jgi:hypothetical protein
MGKTTKATKPLNKSQPLKAMRVRHALAPLHP